MNTDNRMEVAILAGGCFWGMEDLFRDLDGVVDTEVGYIGGSNDNPTYRNHPGHAEALRIDFDTTKTNFEELLKLFFKVHNPTTRNRQGNDIGSSYRSAIFYTNEDQKRMAEEFIEKADESGLWPGPIVTEVVAAPTFWTAEREHQDYLEKHPNGYTCHYVRPEWTLE